MKTLRKMAAGFLVILTVLLVFGAYIAPAPYARQFREVPNAPPSREHLLGTDELGRDSMSRLIRGSQVSLALSPAAALLSTLIAALVGGFGGYLGGWGERMALRLTDVSLSLPWFFLLITVRALLPLNVSPMASVTITFVLLGLLGWTMSARVLAAGARTLRNSDFVLQAQACGCSGWRVFARQVLPNLRPALFAQFWVSIPMFILTEANLGILGLGVAEPLPSWGSLLRSLENWPGVMANPSRLIPLVLLVATVSCFRLILPSEDFAS